MAPLLLPYGCFQCVAGSDFGQLVDRCVPVGSTLHVIGAGHTALCALVHLHTRTQRRRTDASRHFDNIMLGLAPRERLLMCLYSLACCPRTHVEWSTVSCAIRLVCCADTPPCLYASRVPTHCTLRDTWRHCEWIGQVHVFARTGS